MNAEQKFENYLKYARTIMFARQPFYASLIVHAKVGLREGKGHPQETAFTDGKNIFFYDTLLNRITREEFTGILMHEVLHVALQHLPRMKSQNLIPIVWNHATDYYINYVIRESMNSGTYSSNGPSIKLPSWVLYDAKYADMSSEEIYEQLIKNLSPDELEALRNGAAGSGGQSVPGFGVPEGMPDMTGDLQQESVSPEELKEAAEEWKGHVAGAAQQAKLQGNLPAGLERLIGELLYPKVNWKVLLREFIESFPADYDFMEHDRRFTDMDFIIPSLSGETVELVVAVDTSGSFSQEELRDALSETYAMVEGFDHIDITVLACDMRVNNVHHVKQRHDIDSLQLIGGGGTDFRPVFDWIGENKPGTRGLVYFTDGYGSFPDVPPTYKVVWVMMNSEVTAPFGKQIDY